MKLAVLGLGCWGLVLTKLLTPKFDDVWGWSRKQDLTDDLLLNKKSKVPFEVDLDKRVNITHNMQEAIDGADIILLVVSTSAIRPVCEQLKEAGIKPSQILVNTSKGLELPSLKRMSEVIKEVLPLQKFAVLSGPTLAREVLEGKPTAASVASYEPEVACFAQEHLNVDGKFRLYTNDDVIGVELGGSLKNVIAIAAGFLSELDMGDNATGAILTRGMAEIVRVGTSLGAKPSTFWGLSGMGDLIATCSSPLSRNHTVGRMLAQGKKIDDILAQLGSVAEGVKTSRAICELSDKLKIETPISHAIYEAVYSKENSKEIFMNLMSRQLKAEENFIKQ